MYSATNRLVKLQNLLYREETVPTVTQEYNKHSQKEKTSTSKSIINTMKRDQNEFDVSEQLFHEDTLSPGDDRA